MVKNLTRRSFLRAGVAGLDAAALTKSAAAENEFSSAGRPNILYVFADQWQGQALGCAGDPNIQTPHLDHLATEGIRFTQCCSNTPLCSPYRAMLMSGRYPTRTGVYGNNILLPPDEYCIAEHFADAGYAKGYVVKWHLDGDASPGNVRYRQGWQYWAGFNRGHRYFDDV